MSRLKRNLSSGAALLALAITSSSALADSTPASTGSETQVMQCADRAAALATAYPAEYPEMVLGNGSGSALVRVDLDRYGSANDAEVVESTGDIWLDRAARGAALEQRYLPEERNCQAVSGSYLVEVDF